MAAGPEFPAFLKIEHQRDGSARSSFIAEVDSMLGDAERRFKTFSSEASRQLDSAMSVKRNNFGSLDLGVNEMKAAAAAQQARAIAAREVANATAAAAREEGAYNQSVRLSIAATEALAREEEQAAAAARNHADALEQIQVQLNKTKSGTDMLVASNRNGTTANQNVINSTRASRQAFGQLGQQMQDMVVQAQMGTSALVIFTQQVPQAAFALSGLEGSANKTQARIGAFASFLSGPWGAAIFMATAVLGPFVLEMLKSGDAADEAKGKTYDFSRGLNVLELSAKQSADAMAQLSQEIKNAIKVQGDYLQMKDKLANKSASDLESEIAKYQPELDDLKKRYNSWTTFLPFGALDPEDAQRMGELERFIEGRKKALEAIRSGLADSTIATAQQRVIEKLDESAAATGKYERAVADLNNRLRESHDDEIGAWSNNRFISDAEYEKEFERLTKLKDTELESIRERERAQKRLNKVKGDGANLGDMTALLGQIIPGVRITSTTGGKHTAGSDHYKGRAIDFVPKEGMGKYTKAEMRQILMDAGVDIRRNAQGVEQFFGPGDKGHNDHFHLAWEGKSPDPERVAEAAAKAQQALREMGERASESIMRITEKYDEQPKLIDQIAQSTRQLDDIIADLEKRQPIGWEEMVAEARKAQKVVAEAINKPFNDYMKDQERSLAIQGLIAQGREDEAAAMQVIMRLYDQVGVVTEEQQAAIRDNIEAEKELNEVLAKRDTIISAYTSSISSVRSDLESLLGGGMSGGSFLKSMRQNFKQLQGRLMTEQMFGPMLRALEDQIKQSTGVQSSLDVMKGGMENAGKQSDVLATAMERAAARIDGTAMARGGSAAAANAGTPGMSDADFIANVLPDIDRILGIPANDNGGEYGDIVVEGKRTAKNTEKMAAGVNALTPDAYAKMMGKVITAPLATALADIGINISGTLSGAVAGNMIGGVPGAILGGAKGFIDDFGADIFGKDKAAAISKDLGGAMGAFSLAVSANKMIGDIFGFKGGPLGILTGPLKKLINPARTARANITGIDAIDLGGKDKKNYEAANSLAGSVIDGLKSIADTLDAEIGSFNTTIGVRDKKYRVNTNGTSLKTGNGAVDFGDDAEAAVKYAIADAIKDGALMGLRASSQALLQMGDDIEAQLQKVLDFENVFKTLKSYKDPVGAAIDEINDKFEKLIKIFGEAGATAQEWADLEELYGIQRAEAIKQASEAMISSLQDLYDFLSYGDSGLSLRDRDTELRSRYADLKARVERGDSSAFDEYAEVGRELLDVERQLYGSTQAYFDLHAELKATTQAVLDQQKALANAAANSDNPFSASTVPANDNTNVVTAIATLNATTANGNAALNTNLGILIQQQGSLFKAITQMMAQHQQTGSW